MIETRAVEDRAERARRAAKTDKDEEFWDLVSWNFRMAREKWGIHEMTLAAAVRLRELCAECVRGNMGGPYTPHEPFYGWCREEFGVFPDNLRQFIRMAPGPVTATFADGKWIEDPKVIEHERSLKQALNYYVQLSGQEREVF